MCRLRAQIACAYMYIWTYTYIIDLWSLIVMTFIAFALMFISCNKMQCTRCEIWILWHFRHFPISLITFANIYKIVTKNRIANMRKFDLKIAKAMQKDLGGGKLSEIPRPNSKIKGNEQDSVKAIKTLAGARQEEMRKVKKELKEMLPILKPSEVKRFIISFLE